MIQQKKTVLMVFDDMKADMESKKKKFIITKLFLRVSKLNILLVFASKSYFKVPETITLNATHYFIIKISNMREL